MSCPEELELFLLREGGGDLTEERAREVADHLASCAECQAKNAELQALGDALGRPDPLPAFEKAAFVADVVRRIDEAEGPTKAAPVSKFWSVGVPLAAAACCGLVAIVVLPAFLFMGAESEQDAVMAQSAAPSVQLEETESAAPSRSREQQSRGGFFARSADTASAPPPPPRAAMPAPATPAEAPAAAPLAAPPAPERRNIGSALRGGMGGQVASASGGSTRSRSLAEGAAARPRRPSKRAGRGHRAIRSAQSPTKSFRTPPTLLPGQGGPADHSRLGAAPVAQAAAIDPNGRFATTYRPGRGHLARFEKTMLQGRVPEPALAIVADEGRGHGPTVAAPTERALALDIRPGMTKLPPEGGPVHLALTLRSTTAAPASRPSVAVHLVMDTSGSMSGTAIEHARQSARQLVSLLQPDDRFSLVSYSTDARVLVPDGLVGRRRAMIESQISSLVASGGTNLQAGLTRGYEQARASHQAEDSVQLVIVLSDGRPNQGVTNPWTLSEMSAAAFQSGIETTTIGVGDNYEPQVMSTIAEYGAGGYYYLPDASTIEQVLRAELDVRCHPVARGVELRVRLGDGVELLQAYGSRRLNAMESQRVRATEVAIDHRSAQRDGISRDRQEDREGGMRFFIPGFARDDQHTILLRLRAPAGTNPLTLANVELRYKDRVLGSNQGDERQVQVPYGESRAVAIASQDRDVRRSVYSFRTGQALVAVSSHLTRGESPQALALLYERIEMLRRAAAELDDGNLRADADRLDSFRGAVAGDTMNNQLMLGSMVQRAGNGFMR